MSKYERGFAVDAAVAYLFMRDTNNLASACRAKGQTYT